MNIGIDLDDTITNTCDYLTKFIAEYFNLSLEYIKKNNIYYINLPKELKQKENIFLKEVLDKNLKNVPIKPLAKEVINKLKENGFKIYIITARDKKTYKKPVTSTKEQLENFGIKYDKLICTRDKRKACIDNKIDSFIDDSIRNLESVKDVVENVYLFTSPYNKNIDSNFIRVNNWNELYTLIINRNDTMN